MPKLIKKDTVDFFLFIKGLSGSCELNKEFGLLLSQQGENQIGASRSDHLLLDTYKYSQIF